VFLVRYRRQGLVSSFVRGGHFSLLCTYCVEVKLGPKGEEEEEEEEER